MRVCDCIYACILGRVRGKKKLRSKTISVLVCELTVRVFSGVSFSVSLCECEYVCFCATAADRLSLALSDGDGEGFDGSAELCNVSDTSTAKPCVSAPDSVEWNGWKPEVGATATITTTEATSVPVFPIAETTSTTSAVTRSFAWTSGNTTVKGTIFNFREYTYYFSCRCNS